MYQMKQTKIAIAALTFMSLSAGAQAQVTSAPGTGSANSASKAGTNSGSNGVARDTSKLSTQSQSMRTGTEGVGTEASSGGTTGTTDVGTGVNVGDMAKKSPTDAEIAQIVMTTNNLEIESAKVAARKASNPDVKSYAQSMIKDHTMVNQQARDLAKKDAIKPVDSAISKSLKNQGQEMQANLNKLSGKDFDRQYIKGQITMHEQVLRTIDEQLIPGANDQQLKNLITKVRPEIQSHLDHAKSLESKI